MSGDTGARGREGRYWVFGARWWVCEKELARAPRARTGEDVPDENQLNCTSSSSRLVSIARTPRWLLLFVLPVPFETALRAYLPAALSLQGALHDTHRALILETPLLRHTRTTRDRTTHSPVHATRTHVPTSQMPHHHFVSPIASSLRPVPQCPPTYLPAHKHHTYITPPPHLAHSRG